ncbi:MAG TPA: hypothetical protein VGO78_08935 [Acidimicrobiales bacterium]|nr:hypothetical protein [Acidimicrobiales bacterium]
MTGAAGRQRGVVGAGVAAVLLGVVLGVVAGAGASPAEPLLGFAALGAVVAAPGVLALLGLRDRPGLWLPAGLAALPLAFLSFAGLALPLVPVAVVLVMAWVRHPGSHSGTVVHPGVVTPLVVVLLVGAAVALFVSEDPASWTTATGGGSTSDVITDREALLSLACTMLALVAGWTLTRPRRARADRGGGSLRQGLGA